MLPKLLSVAVNHIQGEIDIHLKLLREPSLLQHLRDHMELASKTIAGVRDALMGVEEEEELEIE
jgi:hypothetical protein